MTLYDLAEWHQRMAEIERDAAMRQFHQAAATFLRRLANDAQT